MLRKSKRVVQLIFPGRELYAVAIKKPGPFLGWILTNLDGLLVAYFATFTIWYFQRSLSSILPKPEVWLMAGFFSLAVSGVSYIRNGRSHGYTLSPILGLTWPFLIAFVFGTLIALGSDQTVIGREEIWVFALVISGLSFLWAALLWLDLERRREDFPIEFFTPSEEPPPEMILATKDLPRVVRSE